MSDPGAATPPRRRGRPRAASRTAETSGRAKIVKAAAAEFAEHGYDTTSLRAIARRADVDPALVHHYFSDKAELFAEVMATPFRPDKLLKGVLAGPAEDIGTNIVRFLLEQLDSPKAQSRVVVLLRAALGTGPARRMFKEFLVREVFLRLAQAADGEDAELRATLAASQIVGLMVVRFVLKAEPLASAPIDEIVRRVGPVIQWHLTGIGLTDQSTLDRKHSTGE